MRRGYGSGKVKDLLSFKCGIVSVQRENRIKQKKNSQTSPSTAGVTAFSDERERTGWRKVFAALQYE